MSSIRRRIAAVLIVAMAFAIPVPVSAAPLPSESVTPSAIVPAASVTSVDLKCVTMASDTVAYAAGADGTIIKSTDGGATWVKLNTGTTTADFRGIAFWSTTAGVAVTYNRAVYKTTNGGTTWTVANADMTASSLWGPIGLHGVTAIPGSTDGATVFGGTTPGDNYYRPEQVWRSEYKGGVFWGANPVLASDAHYIPDPLGNPYWGGEGEMLDVDFFSTTHGWAVGDDLYPNEDMATVHGTTDGGYTWSRKNFPAILRLTGVGFGSETNGVTVSSVGRVFFTSNSGTTWTEGTGGGGTALNGVDMSSATEGWAAGAGGKLIRTQNGGSSWAQATSPTTQDLSAICLSGNRGISVGKSGTIVYMSDGATWNLAGSAPVIDTTPPVMTSLTSSTHPIQANWYNGASATFTWSATDNIGVTGYSYVFDSADSTVPDDVSEGSGVTTTISAPEGVRYFHVEARDAAGNWSANTLHYTVRTDRTVPVTGDNAVASYEGGLATILLTPTDGLSGIGRTDWAVTGDASSSGSGSTVVVTGAGSYTLSYASTDNAGNKETTKTASFVIAGDPPATEYTPVEGENRYETAVAASELAFPGGASTVVIATGANWPDALGGAALAGVADAPILLTDPKSLPSAVRAEIVRLGATKAYVLGSTAAVSASVASAIDSIPGMATPVRLAGSNRYGTANAVAAEAKRLQSSYDGVMFVATGLNFPDALAASPVSAAKGWPLYLAAPTGLTSETLNTMKAQGSRVIILGSSAAVPTLVKNQLEDAFPGQVTRLEGGDRYATGLAVVSYATSPAVGLNWNRPAIATGTNFPDALAGGVLQGLDGSILLLTDGAKLTSSVRDAISANKDSILEVRYLGSSAAVSPAVRTAVQNIVQ